MSGTQATPNGGGTATGRPGAQAKRATVLRRLFTSQTDYEFIGRSRQWLLVSLVVLAVAVVAIFVRGINFNIDFTGGTSFTVPDVRTDVEPAELTADLRREIAAIVQGDVTAQVVEDAAGRGAVVTTPALERIGGEQQREVQATIAAITRADPGTIDLSAVGPRWGAQISEQALRALVIFLLLVIAYISVRFEWRMAVAAVITLLHDIAVTVGVYALVGFEVSPASVIALLTILGYSLYDTVVIFDRVNEDAGALTSTSSETYGEAANHAINEVLVRSISTSATSLLPVGSLLFIGGNLLGADTLVDLALALFVGMAVGTYSSIFVATPLMVWLKEKDPRYAELKEKILARRGGEAAAAVQRARSQRRKGGRSGER